MMKNYLPGLSWTFLSLFLITSACNENRGIHTDGLPRSTPESEGVSSEGIRNFLDAAAVSSTEFHSFMFLRHGRVIAEGWWDPYRPDLRHTLYSTSKSFTSTAVGLAVNEGLLNVEDKVVSFFPDELPDTVSPWLAKLTVKDLLTMSAGQDPDPTRLITSADSNWIGSFLACPIVNEPGTRFLYNSMATYMLSAIVQKVSGEKVIDFLSPRLFEPLGISGMDWEVDPAGINTGGWGLRLKTSDMAKFGQLYLQNGEWNGNQVLPGSWVDEATTAHIIQSPEAPQSDRDSSDWLQGYGYQFWRCRNNAFRADGAFGQYIIILPEKDAVIAITAESPNMQSELNLVWEYLLPAMGDKELPRNRVVEASLKARLSALALPLPKGVPEPELAGELDGTLYTFEPNPVGIESLELSFTDGSCEVSLVQHGTRFPLSFRKGSWAIQETAKPGPNLLNNALAHLELLPTHLAAGSYAWNNQRSLELVLRYIESPHFELLTCVFHDDEVRLDLRTSYLPRSGSPTLHGKRAE
jgi:CubicO group peptidase (beta-lactamase class C family)